MATAAKIYSLRTTGVIITLQRKMSIYFDI